MDFCYLVKFQPGRARMLCDDEVIVLDLDLKVQHKVPISIKSL